MPTQASAALQAVNDGETITDRLKNVYDVGAADTGRDPLAELDPSQGAIHTAKQAGLVVGILVLGIVAIVGILVFSTVNNAISLDSGSNLTGPLNDLETFFGDSMSLVGVAMIVGVAALIISLVAGMGGGGDNGGLR